MDNELETARRKSMSQRQRDTERLMRDLSRLANAKASGDVQMIWDALDDIEGGALHCETPAVQQRYKAVLAAHADQRALVGRQPSPAQASVFKMATANAAGESVSFNLEDFGGDFAAMEHDVRSWLGNATLGDRR